LQPPNAGLPSGLGSIPPADFEQQGHVAHALALENFRLGNLDRIRPALTEPVGKPASGALDIFQQRGGSRLIIWLFSR